MTIMLPVKHDQQSQKIHETKDNENSKPEHCVAPDEILHAPNAEEKSVVGPSKIAFPELDVVLDEEHGVYWMYMKPIGRPSFTPSLLRDIRRALHAVKAAFDEPGATAPIRWVVMASALPGIFNLGGDLPRFAALIRSHDRQALLDYALDCIDLQYLRSVNLDLPFINISLVQGDALGGGFECALADDVIIAERGAKFGLPEVLFGLFPGMGALSFLTRRIGRAKAEDLVLSGRIFTAEEMRDLGVVDVLAEDGEGEKAVHDYVRMAGRTFGARRSVYRARDIVSPMSREELVSIGELWVDAALSLGSMDLRKMERLAAAQDRRLAAGTQAVAAG